jgi:hypothetical protein
VPGQPDHWPEFALQFEMGDQAAPEILWFALVLEANQSVFIERQIVQAVRGKRNRNLRVRRRIRIALK